MAKRGFLAQLAYQSQQYGAQQQRAATAAAKQQAAAASASERARRAAERAQQQAARASAAEQKALEKEAQRLHLEARQAEVEALNADLAATVADIDSLLITTLAVDDYVDLESLRAEVHHPPYDEAELETPLPLPPPITAPAEPNWVEPPKPKGLFSKKRHQEDIAQARLAFEAAHRAWQAEVDAIPSRQLASMQEYQQRESARQAAAEAARGRYAAECAAREQEVADSNARLDALIEGLAQNREEAIQEYVGIVLANSAYPDCFQVEHDHTFDSLMRELTVTVTVPPPAAMPAEKEFKYVRAKDEITAVAASAKERRDRYASALCQVAVRTMHEVFESDREGRIQTIALIVGTVATNPATGQTGFIPFISAAVDRSTFGEIDLNQVVPSATLGHLGGLVSKNPFELVAIDTSKGVRGR